MLYPDELRAHENIGRGGEIRTPDILLPKQARYQTALYPVSALPDSRQDGRETILFVVTQVNPKNDQKHP